MSELPDFGISKDAFCPRCGKTTPKPLPEGWIWDSEEEGYFAWCPECDAWLEDDEDDSV